jgi:hypothetical protein
VHVCGVQIAQSRDTTHAPFSNNKYFGMPKE